MRFRAGNVGLQHLNVYLNGVKQHGVIEADDVQGWVERLVFDPITLTYVENDTKSKFETERVYGKVTIVRVGNDSSIRSE